MTISVCYSFNDTATLPNQEMHLCFSDIDFVSFYDFGIVPTVWYFLFFILLCGFKQFRIYDMIFETIYHNANILRHVVVTIL